MPLYTNGQQSQVGRLGILWPAPAQAVKHYRDILLQQLRELGYIEGHTLTIDDRYTDGRDRLLPDMAAELVRLNVDVVLTPTERTTRAARLATSRIPIVFLGTHDPVAMGHVASFARPGGNVTGIYPFAPESSGKLLEFVREFVPALTTVAILWNAPPGAETETRTLFENPARTLGLRVFWAEIKSADDVDEALRRAVAERATGLLVPTFPIAILHRQRIAELAAKHHLPAIGGFREFVEAGGLMAYGPSFPDVLRRGAIYVAKILRGTKPADLPVEQTAKYELVINLKTTRALGLTIPQSVLLRADEVIQ